MNVFFIVLFIAGAFLVQTALGFLQIRHFSKAYAKLRRMGKVAIGKKPGRFRAGTIVLFAVSDSGKILEAKKIQGVTVMARVKDLPGFEGKNIRTLQEADMAHCNHLLKMAILDAVFNYKTIMSGGVIPEKNSLFKNLMVRAERAVALKK
ncbi:transcriptional regulator GutM [Brevibacillus fulvus]|uniref:DNA-binding transcriptional regulator of glucitol operon n=1 Tax=Brevibacillus fulvus TaxID=1125967 RepID=A0A938XYZ0_9BACL|nr:transcriptional regulator GutM [Brevibacillus fulvus]MBM7590381.1 DNA-binding transcriptional regulator of glucitol operon [Brevibacillus fulvus]